MIQSLRQIKSRIRSIESTRKLTRAMEMISISKLRKSTGILAATQEYHTAIEALLGNLLCREKVLDHPFLKQGEDKDKVALCVVTSDNGLCGAYNHALIYMAENFLRRYPRTGVTLVTVGKKSFTYFNKRGFTIARSFVGLNGKFSDEVSGGLRETLTALFTSGKASEVYVAYARMQGTRYKPAVEKLLNIDCVAHKEVDYIFEPALPEILEQLIPAYLASKIRLTLLHAFTSEHQARAVAMGEANQNATELLDGLVLMRNKVRQANITREIIEIISSAEALKG